MNYNCELCDTPKQMSNGRYELRQTKHGILLCKSCYDGNHDGFAQHSEKKLQMIFEAKGIPMPARNAKDLIPRD